MSTGNQPLRDRRPLWRIGALVILSAIPLLTVAAPAHASDSWSLADLTAIAAAPPVSPAAGAAPVDRSTQPVVTAYSTSFPGQGPRARVLYRTVAGHLQELSVAGGGTWTSRQLTTIPDTLGPPFGYTTNLTGQGHVARVVYLNSARQIMELRSTDGSTWVTTNLTTETGAPLAIDEPLAYVTNLTGQGPVARVLYNDLDGQVQELSLAGGGTWHRTLLDVGTYASYSSPHGFVSHLPSQGPVARVGKITGGFGVVEFSLAGGDSWDANRLTHDDAYGPVIGYSTDLAGQGPVARMVYRHYNTMASRYELVELSTAGGPWQAFWLPGPVVASIPAAYVTGKADQAARVVYTDVAGHIVELKVTGGAAWQSTDLTGLVSGPTTPYPPFGYATSLTGQGLVARVLYVTRAGHIQELSALV